jgi:hypothetical protein
MDALELLRCKWQLPSVEHLLTCKRSEIAERFFPRRPYGTCKIRKLLFGRGYYEYGYCSI